MTGKKQSEKKKQTQHTSSSQVKKLEEDIKQLKLAMNEKNDKLLRTLADMQNQQKRMERELVLKEDETKRKYLSELLDIKEILKKASDDENPQEGIKVLLQNIDRFLDNEHITYIDCVGKPFDHTIHHAVTTVEKNDCDDNVVVEEVKKGYLMCDKLLRPAHVVVAKKKNDTKKEGE